MKEIILAESFVLRDGELLPAEELEPAERLALAKWIRQHWLEELYRGKATVVPTEPTPCGSAFGLIE